MLIETQFCSIYNKNLDHLKNRIYFEYFGKSRDYLQPFLPDVFMALTAQISVPPDILFINLHHRYKHFIPRIYGMNFHTVLPIIIYLTQSLTFGNPLAFSQLNQVFAPMLTPFQLHKLSQTVRPCSNQKSSTWAPFHCVTLFIGFLSSNNAILYIFFFKKIP